MKNKDIFLGGFVGALLYLLPPLSNLMGGSGAPSIFHALIYLSLCSIPGFLAGIIGTHALRRVSLFEKNIPFTINKLLKSILGRSIVGGIVGAFALYAIFFSIFAIFNYFFPDN